MKVTFSAGIDSMSGSVKEKNGARLLFKKCRSDQPGHGRAYLLPRDTYVRKTKPSEKELHVRTKFTQASYYVSFMPTPLKMKYYEQWKAGQYKYKDKKYMTLRGYIIARYYANDILAEG